jgi:hypothetical protein
LEIRMSQTAPCPRVVVRRFSRYRDAKLAFDRLRVARIPDRRMSVTGSGLRWRAAFTAKRSADVGAMPGAAVAAALTVLLWSLDALDPALGWFSGGVPGGCFGAVAGIALGKLPREIPRGAPGRERCWLGLSAARRAPVRHVTTAGTIASDVQVN